METKDILRRYSYYYDYLQVIGKRELREDITIEETGLSRGAIQAGYKEMKAAGFQGNLVYYLCYISTVYLIDVGLKNSTSAIKTATNILDNYPLYKSDTVNLCRLFRENPEFLIDDIFEHYKTNYKFVGDDAYEIDKYKVFMLFSSTWYQFFHTGVIENDDQREFLYDMGFEDERTYYNLINKLIEG
jgi:hypothetical protein